MSFLLVSERRAASTMASNNAARTVVLLMIRQIGGYQVNHSPPAQITIRTGYSPPRAMVLNVIFQISKGHLRITVMAAHITPTTTAHQSRLSFCQTQNATEP